MIDFKSSSVFKLTPIGEDKAMPQFKSFLIEGESVIQTFQAVRDQLVFTNKRVITANVQGLTGKKIDFTSIPYAKIQAFSVETAGGFDRDCEIGFALSGLVQVKFEIVGSFDLVSFNKVISSFVL